jgi:hypothetical protein
MKRCNSTTERDEIEADLALLESLQWSKKEFFDRICQASRNQDEKILSVLRLEPTYQFAEFYYLLRARRIETEDDIRRLADIHNKYIVDLTKDPKKMARLGLNSERLLDAMFAADTMPPMHIAAPALSTWRAFSRARSRATCRSSCRLSMSW